MDDYTRFSNTGRQFFHASNDNSIPIIDISSLRSSYISSKKCLKEIEKACTGTGFFTISHHGISEELLNNLENTAANFFSRSEKFKDQYLIGSQGSHSGYVPFTDCGMYSDETAGRLYEAFDLSLDLPESDPDFLQGNIFYGPNLWPNIADFRTVVDEYYQQVTELSHILVGAFEEILGMPHGHMLSEMDKPTSQLRLIHYLAAPRSSFEKAASMGAHTDYELFTILHSKQSGLQTQNTLGEWVDVPVIDGTLIVNIGDMLEVWSNGQFKSNLHRVVDNEFERYSFPYFASLNYNTVVSPWVSENRLDRANYQSVSAGKHLLQQVTRDFSYLREQYKQNNNPFLSDVSLDENPYENTVSSSSGE